MLLIASAAALLVALRSIDFPISEVPWHNDTAHYRLSSVLLLNGNDPYLNKFGNLYTESNLINSPVIERATNPPALVSLYIPFAVMPMPWGYITWSLLQVAALLIALRCLNRLLKLNLSMLEFLVFSAAAVCMCPTIAHLQYGQSQLLVLALITLGAEAAIKSNFRAHSGWALWGIATALKLFTWPLVGVALLFGGWQAALVFSCAVVVMQLPSLVFGSPTLLITYASQALPYVNSIMGSYNSNNGILGAITYSFEMLRGNNPLSASTLSTATQLLVLLCPLFTIIIVKLCWRPRLNRSIFLNVTALALIAACLFSPSSSNHYLVLIIFALLCLFSIAVQNICRPINLVTVLICYCLVALAQGRLANFGVEWQLVSIWWGPLTLFYLAILLILGIRTGATRRE